MKIAFKKTKTNIMLMIVGFSLLWFMFITGTVSLFEQLGPNVAFPQNSDAEIFLKANMGACLWKNNAVTCKAATFALADRISPEFAKEVVKASGLSR